MNKKLVPKRRFKGFTDDWEQRELGEELSLLKDGTHGTHKDVEDGPYLLSAKNIKNGKINISADDRKISEEEFAKIHKNFQLNSGDVLLTIVGSIGEAAILRNTTAITFQRSVAYLRPLGMDSNFLYSLITGPAFQKELENKQVVSAQPGIYLGDLSKIKITISKDIMEQKAIGDFFAQLDHLINLQQRKLNKTKTIKSAYLSEMFPTVGERKPKRRFAGFTDDWEQCKIGDFSKDTYGGGTPKTSVKEYWNGDIPWIQSSDLYEHQCTIKTHTKRITKDGIINSSTKLIPANSIAIVTRVGVGKLAFIPYDYATSQDFLSLSKLKINEWFGVYSLYHKLQSQLDAVQGTSIKGITKEELLNKSILIPLSKKEQKKIGEFFVNLDNLIASQQQKLVKLQNMKKAYLNEMFI